jgi:hypothetical protein
MTRDQILAAIRAADPLALGGMVYVHTDMLADAILAEQGPVPVPESCAACPLDDICIEELNKHKWHASKDANTFYAVRYVKLMPARVALELGISRRRLERMHRGILGAAPGQLVDHRDGNGINNTRANLRFCTNSENQYNCRTPRTNTSGYKGVHWHVCNKRFQAQIKIGGKYHHLGYFLDPIEAARAYDVAALKYHGEFARVNSYRYRVPVTGKGER